MSRLQTLILSKDIQTKLTIPIKTTETNIYTRIQVSAKKLFPSFQASTAA